MCFFTHCGGGGWPEFRSWLLTREPVGLAKSLDNSGSHVFISLMEMGPVQPNVQGFVRIQRSHLQKSSVKMQSHA